MKQQSDHAPKILLAAAGTMGHIAPMLALKEELAALNDIEMLALGTPNSLESQVVPGHGLKLLQIEKVPFPRKPNFAALTFPFRFFSAVKEVQKLISEHQINAVVGFGGYVCPPAYLAARRAKIALIIHEANKRPGLANRLGARFADSVVSTFDISSIKGFEKAQRIGMPLRKEITNLELSLENKKAARSKLNLDPERTTLLVTGGSLGAKHLNQVLIESLAELNRLGVQTIHITGKGKSFEVLAPGYLQLEYVEDMAQVYSAADFAITRSGAGTVSELSALGLPALLVPLPIGNGEQAKNAADLVSAGGAILINDQDLNPDTMLKILRENFLDPLKLNSMAAAAGEYGLKDAGRQLAEIVLEKLDVLDGRH